MPNSVLYGFYALKDRLTDRITDNVVPVVNTAVDATLAEHDRQVNALLNLFAQTTTEHTLRYKTMQASRNQPLDEMGRARKIKTAGHYDIAFPVQKSGSALGWTFEYRVKRTVQDANDELATLLDGDKRWVRDHILAALLTNVTWTFPDEEKGDLTIKGPANNDSDTYLIMNGQDAGGVENHFAAQAAGIDDTHNPFPSIYLDLTEHPENGGTGAKVISLIPSNLKDDVEALAAFKERDDPDVTPAAADSRLTGTLGVAVPGAVIGKANRVWLVEWASLPDDVIISVAFGGSKPLARRIPVEAELQGFKRQGQRNDYPFFEDQYTRYEGYGAWNRVGVRVDLIGSASYSIPSGYSSPMP